MRTSQHYAMLASPSGTDATDMRHQKLVKVVRAASSKNRAIKFNNKNGNKNPPHWRLGWSVQIFGVRPSLGSDTLLGVLREFHRPENEVDRNTIGRFESKDRGQLVHCGIYSNGRGLSRTPKLRIGSSRTRRTFPERQCSPMKHGRRCILCNAWVG